MADKKSDKRENESEENNFENTYNEETEQDIKDAQDLDLLQTQANAQLIVALGFYLEYISSMQAIEVILARRNIRSMEEGAEPEEEIEEEEDEAEEGFKNAGVDADKTALLAAELELLGMAVIARIDGIKLTRFNENFSDKDLLIAKTANQEIYIGAMLELLAYIFNLEGAKKLFNISNENPLFDE